MSEAEHPVAKRIAVDPVWATDIPYRWGGSYTMAKIVKVLLALATLVMATGASAIVWPPRIP